MFYYLLEAVTGLFLMMAIIAFIAYCNGVRFHKTDEQRETEEGLQKTFGKSARWGFFGGAEKETYNHSGHGNHSSHDSHSDSGGGHDGGGGSGGSD